MIDDLVPGFLLEKETGVGTKTALSYQSHINVFLGWLEGKKLRDKPIHKLSPELIAEFFYLLANEKKLDRATCERYFIHIRLLFKYAKKHGVLDEIPFHYVVLPRKKKDQGASAIHPTHLKPLLEEIKKQDPQLFLGCMIQYYCFIRPGKELRLMKIGDIDLEQGLILVKQENAKNSKKQLVTMPVQLIDICYEYGIDKADKSLYIFGNKKTFGDKPVSVNMLRYRFNQIRDKMGLPKDYKFYSFKHTGATSLHMSGISMRELMDQLRHTKLEATQHYLKKHCGIVNDRIRDNFPSPY